MGDYDEETAFLGQTGPYFWTTFFLLNTVFVSTGFDGLYIIFAGAAPRHHCLVPDVNLTDEWRNAVIPLVTADGEEVQSQCSRYKLSVVKNLSDEGYIPGRDINLTNLEQEGCLDGWVYSKDIYQSTIVTEWNLVCDNQWKVPFASSTLFVGYLVGSLISGQLSDRFGRKKVVFVSLAAQSLSVLLQSFSQSWRMFCIMFLFVGASQISIYISAFVLGTELLSKTMRVLFTTLGAFLFYCIGYMTLPWIAYGIRDWRTLLAVLSATSVVYIPLWWFLPESPRWLITQGKAAEAEIIVREAARKNKVQAPPVVFKESEIQDMPPGRKYTMLDILKSFNLRCITLMCLLLWMAINIGYFGLSLNTSNLSGNPFMNCFLSAISEVPAYIVSTCLLRKCPRRELLSTFLIIGGGVLLLIQFIPDTLQYVALALEMSGKFGFTMAFTIVYIYTAEIYPTVLRNVGMGMCSSAARIGSITAPYVIYLGTYNKVLPYILMGSLTISSSVVNLFLPETFNKDLPETVEQILFCPSVNSRSPKKHRGRTSLFVYLSGALARSQTTIPSRAPPAMFVRSRENVGGKDVNEQEFK
uniref:Solute carrier family 22 member 5 n=1 Tax=Nothobranchius furzeri TaxID=105023 RepID=A0A8C6PQS9_NOTFU